MDTQKIVDNILGEKTKTVKQISEQNKYGVFYEKFITIQHPKSGNIATIQISILKDKKYNLPTQITGIIMNAKTDEIYLQVRDMKENYEKLKDKLYMDLPKIKANLLKKLG